MLVQHSTLEQHRLLVPLSITKPVFKSGTFGFASNQQHYRALVDTGAQRTVLSRSIIRELNLTRTGHLEMAGIHGPRTHSRYLAGIGFWSNRATSIQSDGCELTLFTLDEPVEVVDMDNNRNFELILGFDVLKNFTFEYRHHEQAFTIVVQP